RGFESRGRLDRNDIATLGGENVLDVHVSPPSACSERAECRLDNARFDIEFRQLRHPASDGPPGLYEERPARRALDIDRVGGADYAGIIGRNPRPCKVPANRRRSSACSPKRWLMNRRCRTRPFAAVEFGRNGNRIECGEGKKPDQ